MKLAPPPLLSLSSFGPFQASLANAPIPQLSSEKLSALLIYLAMKAGHRLRREHLAELLWPGMHIEAARSNLRHAIFRLRQVLGDDVNAQPFLLSGREWLSFNPDSPYQLDASEFNLSPPTCPAGPQSSACTPCLSQMEGLAHLYRGEFMADLSLPDCAEFNDWLQIERETMRRRALVLLERLSVCHEQINGLGQAVPFALRYLELEPWNEEGLRRVMRLHALNGQTSAALVQYDSCCRLLKKELGVLPGIETQKLAENIRSGSLHATPRGANHTQDRRAGDIAKTMPVVPPMPLPAERRQATVLYCELTYTENGDIDETMSMLQAPQARCVEIIGKFHGHLVKTHGGGLLAYFGYPQARENAARLAVKAALALTREAGNGIEIRTGVHTGLIISSGDLSLPDVAGKTSRLAIQLRQIARPGEVAISEKTHQLVEGYFECATLPGRSFSGIDRSSEIFRVIRESGAHTRLEAASQLTPLVGRKTEISQLLKLWKSATQGERHVVLIQGEAGLGKSRLLHALKATLAEQPHLLRELRCFPEFSQSPFHPLIAVFKENWNFSPSDTPELEFDKLVGYLETHYPATAQDAIPLLALLLSLPLPDHYQVAELTPAKKKELTISILIDMLQARGTQQPVLFLVEDLHWIDPSTLEFLIHLIDIKKLGNILVVLTARPEFSPPWSESGKTRLELTPLDSEDAAKMIVSMREDIPAATLHSIQARADGVPLFIEEMVKVTTLNSQTNIPVTLHDLLAARIDQVGEARYTAQLAATIGREFELDLLRKIYPRPPEALAHSLGVLQDAGLILNASATTHQFKHALIQEAAYHSQTLPDRQAAHQRIALILQSDFPDVVATQPELLAQHLSEGGETTSAIEYWNKAAQRASLNSANLEAIAHCNSGLRLLMTLPEDLDRHRTEFSMLVKLCPILYAAKGYGSTDAIATNARISALSTQVGDSPELFQANWAFVMNSIANPAFLKRASLDSALQLLNLAHDDPLRMQAAHFAASDAAFWLGEFETSRVHAEQAIALYRPAQRQMQLEQYGEDLSLSCAAYLCWALYFLGYPDRAQQICQQMLTRARELNHPQNLGFALCFASLLHRWLWKPAETLALSAETIAVSREHDLPVWLAAGEMTHGWAQVMHGQREGITELKSGITGMRASIAGISVPFLSALAEAYVHLEMYNEALGQIEEALADAVSTGDGHFTAELHRLKGECLLALSPSNSAEAGACFNRAIAISRKQGAKSMELRATNSIERLTRQRGRK